MNSLVSAVRRHPLAAWLVWFFTVGQAFAFAPLVLRGAGVDVPVQPFIVGSTIVGLFLPTLVITRIVDGPQGLRAYWADTTRVRVPLRWYALAVVVVPVATFALNMPFADLPRDTTTSDVVTALGAGLLLQGFLVLVTNNWWEEAAWTGFFQARLQQRHSPLLVAVITGPLFALQHISLAVPNGLIFTVVAMSAFALIAIPFRALVGWAYGVTGSLFLVGLIHAAGNAMASGSGFFGAGFLPQLYGEGGYLGGVHQFASAVIGVLVIAATRGRLGRRAAPARAIAPSVSSPDHEPAAAR